MKESKKTPKAEMHRDKISIYQSMNCSIKTNLIFKIIEIHIVFMDWKTQPGKNVIPPTFFFFLTDLISFKSKLQEYIL